MHRTNTGQPNLSRLVVPNKKCISGLQHTNEDPGDRENELPANEYLGINDVEGRTNEGAQQIHAIPPSASQAFCQPTEKIDET